jgi:hypothetical protein
LSNGFEGRLRPAIRLKGFAEPVDAYEINSELTDYDLDHAARQAELAHHWPPRAPHDDSPPPSEHLPSGALSMSAGGRF